jgi:hypothetical protein
MAVRNQTPERVEGEDAVNHVGADRETIEREEDRHRSGGKPDQAGSVDHDSKISFRRRS